MRHNRQREQQKQWLPILLLFQVRMVKQQNIMQLSYIMTLDLKQLRQSWRFTKIPDIKIFCTRMYLHCLYHHSLSQSLFHHLRCATERSGFIHNNLCYCVRPPLCVYCFGLVLSVASMWRTDESLACAYAARCHCAATFALKCLSFDGDFWSVRFGFILKMKQLTSFCNCQCRAAQTSRKKNILSIFLPSISDATEENTLASTTHKFVM